MNIITIILLIFLGMVLLLIEFAVIPGVTIAGIGGFSLLAVSVYIAFTQYGTAAGFLTLTIVLIFAPMMIYYLFKSRTGKKMILESKIDGTVDSFNRENVKVGDVGQSIGRLAPTGKVRINDETVEAQSTGVFIDHRTDVRVVKILSNKIIVEPINNEYHD